MAEYTVRDEGLVDYFAMIPNIVCEMGLTPYEMMLYMQLKRVAGESGVCYKSTVTLARACNMSTGSVWKAKRSLAERGLIRIENDGTGHTSDHITIVNIWEHNHGYFIERRRTSAVQEERSPGEQSTDERSPGERNDQERSPGEFERSPGEPKNTPLRIPEEIKNNNTAPAAQQQYQPPYKLPEPRYAKPFFPGDALTVFTLVTGMYAFPAKSKDADIERITALHEQHNGGLEEFLVPFYEAWVGPPRGYNKINTGWLDWAIAGEIPKTKAEQESARFDEAFKEVSNANGD